MACADCVENANMAQYDGFRLQPCDHAADVGHIHCLKYYYGLGKPWWSDMFYAASKAALNGHMNCMCFAHEHGCIWTYEATRGAAQNGHMDCLVYAHEHGAPMDVFPMATYFAAANGHLDCLKYVHKHGAPWDRQTCGVASSNGHLTCFHYAYTNGAPLWEGASKVDIDKWCDSAERAATTIQRSWLERHYAPGGHGAAKAMARLCTFSKKVHKNAVPTAGGIQKSTRPMHLLTHACNTHHHGLR